MSEKIETLKKIGIIVADDRMESAVWRAAYRLTELDTQDGQRSEIIGIATDGNAVQVLIRDGFDQWEFPLDVEFFRRAVREELKEIDRVEKENDRWHEEAKKNPQLVMFRFPWFREIVEAKGKCPVNELPAILECTDEEASLFLEWARECLCIKGGMVVPVQ